MQQICILIAFLGINSIASAVTIRIPNDHSTIQSGIDAALTGDTVLVADGTYTSFGNRNLNFNGKDIILISENGPEVTIIDCNGSFSSHIYGLTFQTGETNAAIVEGFTIKRGYAASSGGGITCINSSPTIRNNIIINNENWGRGGGIYCRKSSAVISGNLITNNTSFKGGGIACDSSNPTITNNTISNNVAHTFQGGGIYLQFSNPVIVNNVISNNWSFDEGGGIFCWDSKPILNGNTISSNTNRSSGGGIFLNNSDASVSENLIYNNTAYGNGGGIACWGSSLNLIGNTIILNNVIDNRPPYYGGSGIHISQSSPILRNNIIAFNTGSEAITCLDSINPDIKCTNIYGNEVGNWTGCISFQVNSYGNISQDPLFCDTSAHDYHLAGNSPCAPSNNICNVLIGALEVGCNPTGISDNNNYSNLPSQFNLNQNYPNPFNPTTTIEFELPKSEVVKLEVVNLLGQRVALLVNRKLEAGKHSFRYDGSDLGTGIYFYRLTSKSMSVTKKMILLK